MLEIILHMGNFLNAGNSRLGAAMGFNLETLAKLHDTKTSDNKQTVFDITVEMVKDQQPSYIAFTKAESELMDDGARISLQTVEAEKSKLVKEFYVVKDLAPTIVQVDADDLFGKRFEEFRLRAEGEVVDIEKKFEEAKKNYESVVKLFGEDPATMGPEEFFAIWKTFVGKIIETSEKIDVEREKKDKERKREEQKLKREQELAAKANKPAGGDPPAEGGEGDARGGRGGRRGGRGGREGGRGGRGGDADNVKDLFAKVQGGKKT